METYRTRVMRKKTQGNIVLRGKHDHLNLVLIISMAISGSSRGEETLDTGMLDINNQDCIRKKRREHTLEEIASEEVLSGAGCLAVMGIKGNLILRQG